MKEELSDFLKFAYKTGRIKDANEEILKEYPVEEEYHKGKVENILREKVIPYNNIYSVGDIVYVKLYKYKNGANGNNHLFVIIDKNNLVVPIENIGMLISSNVIYKIKNSQILFKIGQVDLDKVEEYKKSYYNL